ncbi:LysM peptidoglycan-binding domain-containing protein [uncultured Tateyamaria sp.]|uniref:LysM peptidoglycan-binding domain-containing protein n=1 Tax=uncultured Tateyamaria sp. TaxID=455651 RepID=UPI00262B722B|nr:LysM peptidoglycan-binding domain-containing protein [uncultured Tateyamaria sp.]
MSKWAAFAGSNGALAGTAVVVIAAAVGAGFFINANQSEPTSVAQPTEIDAPSVPEVAAVQPKQEAPTEPEALPLDPPSIDEVRVEPDGLTVIAGRAVPGSKVAVLLDGAENTETTTDDGGSFAAITILPQSPKARVLTVIQRVGMDEIASVDEVILAPQAQPAPEPEAQKPVGVAAADAQEGAPDPVANDVAATVLEPVETPTEPAPATTFSTLETPQVAEAAGDIAEPETVANAPATEPTVSTEVAQAPVVPQPTPPPEVETVNAPEAPADTTDVTVLRSTADGVEVLSNTPPDALDNIALDSISYSDQGDVELAGRAQPEADAVRVYVNNAPVADIEVSADGNWRGELPQIDTGTYTLRVDELNAEGEVTSRVETPFRREDPDVLAQADTEDAPATQITVQAGNTLWAIARDRYGEGTLFVQVFEANRDRIRNPDLIFPGQVFALPN